MSPFEHWYAAIPASEAGDLDRAIEILAEGLREWPDHPRVHYNLACLHARAGHREQALHHLSVAAGHEPAALERAATDPDLDAIRDDPAFPRAGA